MEAALRAAVTAAAARADACGAVGELYADVRAEIDRRRPLCVASGRCCRFEEYGHRLFVTTLELAAFVRGLSVVRLPSPVAAGGVRSLRVIPAGTLPTTDKGPPTPDPARNGTGCPFQVDKLCGVHPIRPFGCRMFFCDATSTDWQNDAYERFHARLKTLHEQLGVPYFYVEWRMAIEAVGLRI